MSDSHFIIVKSGVGYACGKNTEGQLGDGTTTNRSSFVPMIGQGTSGITLVQAFSRQTSYMTGSTIIVKSGVGYGCGDNYYGQLGTGTTTNYSTLTPMVGQGTSGITAISSSNYSTLVLKGNSVYGCGKNNSGNLGIGNNTLTITQLTAAIGAGASGVVDISAGQIHSCILKSNGSVWCTGWNNFGQLADGTVTNKNQFTATIGQGTSGVSKISCGRYSTSIIKGNALYGAGCNRAGQLGTEISFTANPGTFQGNATTDLSDTYIKPSRTSFIKAVNFGSSGVDNYVVCYACNTLVTKNGHPYMCGSIMDDDSNYYAVDAVHHGQLANGHWDMRSELTKCTVYNP